MTGCFIRDRRKEDFQSSLSAESRRDQQEFEEPPVDCKAINLRLGDKVCVAKKIKANPPPVPPLSPQIPEKNIGPYKPSLKELIEAKKLLKKTKTRERKKPR